MEKVKFTQMKDGDKEDYDLLHPLEVVNNTLRHCSRCAFIPGLSKGLLASVIVADVRWETSTHVWWR